MNLGVVGFSNYFQKAYAAYLHNEPFIRLSAVYDPKPAAQLVSLIKGCLPTARPQLFNNWQDFLAFEEVDAVLISTPHVFHFEQVLNSLKAGRHVFVDKPLACRYAEAQQLVDLANKLGLVLMVGNQRRYEAPYQQLKRIIRGGEMGEIRLMHYLFANSPWYDYRNSWRGDPSINCGGAMIDIGHLAVDTLIWLLEGRLMWVEAEMLSTAEWPAEDTVMILAEFEPHVTINLTITYAAPFPSVQEELSIYGTQCSSFTRRFAAVRFGQFPPTLTQIPVNGKPTEFAYHDKPQAWRPLEDFCNGIKTGQAVLSDGVSNLRTVEFIDNVYRSARERQRIYLRNHAALKQD
jgi:predicted dehydrogenase